MSDVSEIMLNRIERRDWLGWNLLPPKPITLRALKQLQIRVLQDHICYNTMHGNNKATSFNHGSSNGICRNLGFGPNMIVVITRRMMRMWTQMMSSTFCPGVNPSHIMAPRRFSLNSRERNSSFIQPCLQMRNTILYIDEERNFLCNKIILFREDLEPSLKRLDLV